MRKIRRKLKKVTPGWIAVYVIMGLLVAFMALPLVYTLGWVPVFIISCIALLIWSAAAFFIIRNNRKN